MDERFCKAMVDISYSATTFCCVIARKYKRALLKTERFCTNKIGSLVVQFRAANSEISVTTFH